MLCACGAKQLNLTPPAPTCLSLIAKTLGAPTPSAPIPPVRTAGSLAAFADAQTGQLDLANDDKEAIFRFEAECRARDAAMRAALTRRKRFLGIF